MFPISYSLFPIDIPYWFMMRFIVLFGLLAFGSATAAPGSDRTITKVVKLIQDSNRR